MATDQTAHNRLDIANEQIIYLLSTNADLLIRVQRLEAAQAASLTPTSDIVSVESAIALIAAAGKIVNPDPVQVAGDAGGYEPDPDDLEPDPEYDDWTDIPTNTAFLVAPDQGEIDDPESEEVDVGELG
jgi:hypothetical protein